MKTYSIALDAMGGDHGIDVTVPAALGALEHYDDIRLILVGDEERLSGKLDSMGVARSDRVLVRHASQVVEMHDPPAMALRIKKDSSIRVAVNLVKSGEADAIVSAGNTGALMAISRFVLKTLAGIDRPAIITSIPSVQGHTHMLDLGANVDCKAQHLFQFAAMGSVLASAVDDLERPRVGLLNVGQEAIKGNEQVKEANQLLERSSLNYIGYVEGDDIYCSEVDVVVCDGFVGNVSLKSSEGVARMITQFMRREVGRSWLSRIGGLMAVPMLRAFSHRFDPRRYNGATLLGLQGVVIKSHGGADTFSFENAIKIARVEAEKCIPQRIKAELEHLINE